MKKVGLAVLLFVSFGVPNFMQAQSQNESASEDDDLEFLSLLKNDRPADNSLSASKEGRQHLYKLDNIYQYTVNKDSVERIFQAPAQNDSSWNNLLRLGLRADYSLSSEVLFKTDLLLNGYSRKDDSFNASEDTRIDVKEVYLSWQKTTTDFLDFGRVNIKSGIATGFNPTDYFKVGSLLDRKTEDIRQLRDARLGALVLRGQKLWDKGSVTFIASPEISTKTDHWTSDKNVLGLNLHKTNDRSRGLLKLTHEISDGLSPELIYYRESGEDNLGLNISKVLNNQWFIYTEWNVGERRSLVDEALVAARESKQLAADIARQFGDDEGKQYLQQLAIGVSFTSAANITTKLEYHYNEAGLSVADARNWFKLGRDFKDMPDTIQQLLSIRGLAQTKGEYMGQDRLFVYSSWADAGLDDLNLMGLVMMDAHDKSLLMQLEAAYTLVDSAELSIRFAKYQGDTESLYGSLNQDYSLSLQIKYSF